MVMRVKTRYASRIQGITLMIRSLPRRCPMVPSTKLITIREAAERLGLKESTIRKYILKRQIAYVKPSVRAVRIPIEELERILAAGLRPAIPQAEAAR
ncbi:MAG: helix-turn-helix domain-containing protein [Nitrospira sp. CR1.1]|nr:helix-turn-helix domain-containing protein [Nitrospira sp. CR1.1]